MTDLMLILNTAEGRVQSLMLQDGAIIAAQDWAAPSQGTEVLTPLLADMFRRTGHRPSDLSRIACVTGPGSFTGIRLGLTTAAALRRATGAPVGAINYLQALATNLPSALLTRPKEGPYRVRVLTHARRGLVHGQDFFLPLEQPFPAVPQSPPLPEGIGHPTMLDLAGACASPLPDALIGSGVTRNLAFLRANLPARIPLLCGQSDQPSPHALASAALALPPQAWEQRDMEPLYLRPCDAVDNLSSIATKRGENPELVHAELRRLLSVHPTT